MSSPRRPGRPAARETIEASPCRAVENGCQIGDLFRLLGKAHVLDVLHVFISETSGPLRFVEVQNRLKLSPNTLSDRLSALTKAGLLTRTAYNEIPPRVDYEATAKAHDLRPVFDALHAWASSHDLSASASADAEAATA